jgi:hypothetical protein
VLSQTLPGETEESMKSQVRIIGVKKKSKAIPITGLGGLPAKIQTTPSKYKLAALSLEPIYQAR